MPLACLSFLLLVLMFSCKKEDSTTSSSPGASFTASIAGVDWKADSVWAYLARDTAHNFKTLTITGYGASKELTVILTDSSQTTADSAVSVRIYALGASDLQHAVEFVYASTPVSIGSSDTVWSKYGLGYDGQAAVTADDASAKKVSGNFHFDAKAVTLDSTGLVMDTVKVTNGIFKNIPYKYSH